MRKEALLDLAYSIGAVFEINEALRICLEMLREIVWFDRGIFWLYDPVTGHPTSSSQYLDVPDMAVDAYLNRYIALDEVREAYRSSRLLIIRSTKIFTYSQWSKNSEFYNCFLKTFDMHYLVGYDIKEGEKTLGALCLTRSKKTGDFKLHDINNLKLIYPHLQNRLRWHHVLHTYQSLPILQRPKIPRADMVERLTLREQQIVELVMTGANNPQIAGLLGISRNTVKMHLQNVYDKLQINNRYQLFSTFDKQADGSHIFSSPVTGDTTTQ